MSKQILLSGLELLFDSDDGIEKAKNSILSLAVSGKLVSQLGTEKPAVNSRGIEGPFDLPEGWSWQRLPDVASDLGQCTPSSDFTYIDVSSIDKDRGVIGSELSVIPAKKAPSRARKMISVGSVIYSTVRPYLRNIAIINQEFDPPAIASTAFAVLHPSNSIESSYLYYCLRSEYFTKYVESKQKGVAYPAINAGDLSKAVIPVPPKLEQIRIVAKVEELFNLCEVLAAETSKKNELGLAAARSTFDSISIAQSEDDLITAWERIESNWEEVLETSQSVSLLKLLIFDLALKGVYSESAEFENIQLKNLAQINYGYTESAQRNEVGPKFLRITDIQEGKVDWASVPFCPISDSDERKHQLKDGDLVFARTGATTGKSYLVQNPPRSVCASYLIRVRPDSSKVLPEYLYFYFQSGQYWMDVRNGISGTAQGGFNSSKLGNLMIQIPSIESQSEIVSKVKELLLICDSLQEELNKLESISQKLTLSIPAKLAM